MEHLRIPKIKFLNTQFFGPYEIAKLDFFENASKCLSRFLGIFNDINLQSVSRDMQLVLFISLKFFQKRDFCS